MEFKLYWNIDPTFGSAVKRLGMIIRENTAQRHWLYKEWKKQFIQLLEMMIGGSEQMVPFAYEWELTM